MSAEAKCPRNSPGALAFVLFCRFVALVEHAQYVAGDVRARERAQRQGLDPWDVDQFFAWVLNQ